MSLRFTFSRVTLGPQRRLRRQLTLLRTRAHLWRNGAAIARTRTEQDFSIALNTSHTVSINTIDGSRGLKRAAGGPDGTLLPDGTAGLALESLGREIVELKPETTKVYKLESAWKFDFWGFILTLLVQSLGKMWINLPILGPRTVTVFNQPNFEKLVTSRPKGQSMITVSNHTATMDDPVIWSTLPSRFALLPHRSSRWTVAAKEICFFNPFVSWFFLKGQNLPIVRGDGIYQRGMQTVLDRVCRGGWIHIFSEGRVHQGRKMLPFKWGVGRLILEAQEKGYRTPWFIPVYTRGMDRALPLGKKNIPRPGHDFLLAFGEPVDFGPIVEQVRARYPDENEARSRITSIISDLVHELQIKSIEQWRDRLGRDPTGYEGGVGGEPWIGADAPPPPPLPRKLRV